MSSGHDEYRRAEERFKTARSDYQYTSGNYYSILSYYNNIQREFLYLEDDILPLEMNLYKSLRLSKDHYGIRSSSTYEYLAAYDRARSRRSKIRERCRDMGAVASHSR